MDLMKWSLSASETRLKCSTTMKVPSSTSNSLTVAWLRKPLSSSLSLANRFDTLTTVASLLQDLLPVLLATPRRPSLNGGPLVLCTRSPTTCAKSVSSIPPVSAVMITNSLSQSALSS